MWCFLTTRSPIDFAAPNFSCSCFRRTSTEKTQKKIPFWAACRRWNWKVPWKIDCLKLLRLENIIFVDKSCICSTSPTGILSWRFSHVSQEIERNRLFRKVTCTTTRWQHHETLMNLKAAKTTTSWTHKRLERRTLVTTSGHAAGRQIPSRKDGREWTPTNLSTKRYDQAYGMQGSRLW